MRIPVMALVVISRVRAASSSSGEGSDVLLSGFCTPPSCGLSSAGANCRHWGSNVEKYLCPCRQVLDRAVELR